jgi:hypothetical protein
MRAGVLARLALLAGCLAPLARPTTAAAWPAIQAGGGVHLCDSRPYQQPDGRWTCRSGGLLVAGDLVDVSRGWGQPPGAPPGVGPPPGRGPAGSPYGPWAPPGRGSSGYDELDPWLGERRER